MRSVAKSMGLTSFSAQELFGPIAVLIISAYVVGTRSASLMLSVQFTLCFLVMVLALQVFVGNSGVLSFGHGAFAMIGAFVSGLATAPFRIKDRALALQDLWPPLVSFNLNIYVSHLGVLRELLRQIGTSTNMHRHDHFLRECLAG